jgi:hypothetical protein
VTHGSTPKDSPGVARIDITFFMAKFGANEYPNPGDHPARKEVELIQGRVIG